MEISKKKDEHSEQDVWMISQQSHAKDTIQKDQEKVRPKRIPLS